LMLFPSHDRLRDVPITIVTFGDWNKIGKFGLRQTNYL
jgi:hypothetical protein